MRRKPIVLITGFICAFLVAMAAHFRNEAIRQSPPISGVSADASKLSREDFSRDIRRLQDEFYDPIRPVAKEGTFLLVMEKTAYAVPGAFLSSLLSPVLLPVLFYPEQLRQSQRQRLPLGASLPSDIESSARLEGTAWGVFQILAFYAPFFLIGKKRGLVAKLPD